MAEWHGKKAFMHATAEIDKAGRLIIPKKLRTALHLVPGTRIRLEQQEDAIILRHETDTRELVEVNGVFVLKTGSAPMNFDLEKFLNDEREARIQDMIAARIIE